MDPLNSPQPERTHNVRTKVALIGIQGAEIEADNRKKATGKRGRLADIYADWIEERGAEVVAAKLKG